MMALDRSTAPGPAAYRKARRAVAIAAPASASRRHADRHAGSESLGDVGERRHRRRASHGSSRRCCAADVPVLNVVTGEGGSGGALAFASRRPAPRLRGLGLLGHRSRVRRGDPVARSKHAPEAADLLEGERVRARATRHCRRGRCRASERRLTCFGGRLSSAIVDLRTGAGRRPGGDPTRTLEKKCRVKTTRGARARAAQQAARGRGRKEELRRQTQWYASRRAVAILVALALVAAVIVILNQNDEGGRQRPDATSRRTTGRRPTPAATPGDPPENNAKQYEQPATPGAGPESGVDYGAIIETSCGTIEVDLLEKEAPSDGGELHLPRRGRVLRRAHVAQGHHRVRDPGRRSQGRRKRRARLRVRRRAPGQVEGLHLRSDGNGELRTRTRKGASSSS